jgi:TonB family protein
MTVYEEEYESGDEVDLWTRLRPVAFAAVVLAIVAGIWWASQQMVGTRKSAPPIPTITLAPPPPPPPPPKPLEQKQPEPDKIIEAPRPVDQPQQAAPPLTINGPAQAGGDSFGLQAGSGGGMALGGTPGGLGNTPGGAFAEGAYQRQMSSAFTAKLQSDPRVNRWVGAAEVSVSIDGSGVVSRVAIAQSSGNARTDEAIVSSLTGLRLDGPPAPGMRFPQRAKVRARK